VGRFEPSRLLIVGGGLRYKAYVGNSAGFDKDYPGEYKTLCFQLLYGFLVFRSRLFCVQYPARNWCYVWRTTPMVHPYAVLAFLSIPCR
jgi:hypothetical protein